MVFQAEVISQSSPVQSASDMARQAELSFQQGRKNASELRDARVQFHSDYQQASIEKAGPINGNANDQNGVIGGHQDRRDEVPLTRKGQTYVGVAIEVPLVGAVQGGRVRVESIQNGTVLAATSAVDTILGTVDDFKAQLEGHYGDERVEAFLGTVGDLYDGARGKGDGKINPDDVVKQLQKLAGEIQVQVIVDQIRDGLSDLSPATKRQIVGLLIGVLGAGVATYEAVRRKKLSPEVLVLTALMLTACFAENPGGVVYDDELTLEPTIEPTIEEPEPTIVPLPTPQEILPTPTVFPEPTLQSHSAGWNGPSLTEAEANPIPGNTGGPVPERLQIYFNALDEAFNIGGDIELRHQGEKWAFLVRNNKDLVMWAYLQAGGSEVQGDFPAYYRVFTDENGDKDAVLLNEIVVGGVKHQIEYKPVPDSDEADVVWDDGEFPVLVRGLAEVDGKQVYLEYFDSGRQEWLAIGEVAEALAAVPLVPEEVQAEVEAKGLGALIEQEGLVWSEGESGFVYVNPDTNLVEKWLSFDSGRVVRITDVMDEEGANMRVGMEATAEELAEWEANRETWGEPLSGTDILSETGETEVVQLWEQLRDEFNVDEEVELTWFEPDGTEVTSAVKSKNVSILYSTGPEGYDPSFHADAFKDLEGAGWSPVYRRYEVSGVTFSFAVRYQVQGDRLVIHVMTFAGGDGRVKQFGHGADTLGALYFGAKSLSLGRVMASIDVQSGFEETKNFLQKKTTFGRGFDTFNLP